MIEEALTLKTEQQYFEEAKPIATYMQEMTELKDDSHAIYEKFDVPHDGFIERLAEQDWHILAITEDWCGDAMLNNPVIRKLAEAAGLPMRAVLRDADTDLIDRYLTNGGRAIPIYIILNAAGEVVATWGPRAPELQQEVVDKRAELPAQDDPTFKEAQQAMYTAIRNENLTTPMKWQYVYQDFKRVVEKAFTK